MNWKRLITGALVAVGLLAAAFVAYQAVQAPTPTPAAGGSVADADTGSVVVTAPNPDDVLAQGVVIPLAETSLAFQVGGQVAEILVAPGQAVQAGDPLIRLDGRQQALVVREAETAVLAAQADLTLAQAGLAAAQADLSAANVAITAAEVDLDALTAAPTAAEVALQDALVGAADAGVQEAAGNQSLVLAGSSAAEIGVAEANLAAAQAQLFATRLADGQTAQNENAAEEERRQAQLRISAAEAAVAAAQARLDEVRAGASTGAQNAAAGSVSAAVAQRGAAEAGRDLLLAAPRPEAIAVAQANLEQARRAAAETAVAVEQAEIAVTQAAAGVQQAEAELQEAQALFDKTILHAPFAGTVAAIDTRGSEIAQPAVPVLTLINLDAWQVITIDLSELDVVAVQPDAPVVVTLDAFPDQPLRGRVVDLATSAGELDGNVTYEVTIALEETTLPLRWGMPAFVSVQAAGE